MIKASLAVKVGLEHTAAIEKAKYSGIFSCLTNRIVSSFVNYIKRNLLFAFSNTCNDFAICSFVNLAVIEILILA